MINIPQLKPLKFKQGELIKIYRNEKEGWLTYEIGQDEEGEPVGYLLRKNGTKSGKGLKIRTNHKIEGIHNYLNN